MPVTTRIIDIQERDHCTLARPEVFDSQGRSLIIPETRKLNAVEITDTLDGVRVMAQGLVGYLPLTSKITLNITPKFPIANLWAMLELAGEEYNKLLPIMRGYQTGATRPPAELLLRCFCHYLTGVISTGFERSYYSRQVSGFYKPRIEFGRTVNTFLSRGNPINTVSTVHEFGLDSKINRLIKVACIVFSRMVPRSSDWSAERRLFQLALDTLQRVHEQSATEVDLRLDQCVSQRSRESYAGMLRVYHLLVSGDGVTFSYSPRGTELPSVLFNLDNIFEKFIRCTCDCGLHDRDIIVTDGNKRPGRLFVDNKTYPIKPDVIFRLGGRKLIGLGEVKYKPKLKEADRYQIISHMTASTAPVGILFTPAEDGERQRLERIGQLATSATLYHYRVDIRKDLVTAQDQMINDLMQIPSFVRA